MDYNPRTLLLYDGLNDVVTVPTVASLNFGTGDFTIALQLTPTVQNKYVINKRDSAAANNAGWHIRSDGYVRIADGVANVAMASTGYITDTTAYHMTTAFDRDGVITVYKNAVSVATSPSIAAIGSVNNARDLWIGAREDNGVWVGGFAGYIGEIMLFSRLLGVTEIAYNYEHPHDPYSQTGLVLWFRVDEGTGVTLNDMSASNNDGTISGATWKQPAYWDFFTWG